MADIKPGDEAVAASCDYCLAPADHTHPACDHCHGTGCCPIPFCIICCKNDGEIFGAGTCMYCVGDGIDYGRKEPAVTAPEDSS